MRVAVAALAACAMLFLAAVALPPSVPRCQEDEVVVGVGDFHSSGYWDAYRCWHVENAPH